MTRGIHIIMTAYGFWLPNDPRGSWSDMVRAWELVRFGPATGGANIRRSVAAVQHNKRARTEAKKALARHPVIFDGHQAVAIATGFRLQSQRSKFRVHALSVLPDHVHIVVSHLRIDVDKAAELMKGSATAELARRNLHPFQDDRYRNDRRPTPWARHCWKVFLYNDAAVFNAISYVERNPEKEDKRRQLWPFIAPYIPWS